MAEITSWNQLENVLMNIVKSSLAEVGEKINDKLRSHVESDVYINSNTSYAYGTGQPTYDLRESITTSEVKTTGNTAEVEVFHDKEKMKFDPDNFVHSSRYWKDGTTDIREILPIIIDMGLGGSFFGDGWWTDERPYFRNTVKELHQGGLLNKWMKDALRKRGLSVR
jgi:hypothetical protein